MRGNATARARWRPLQTYGGAIGLAFQVVDDILDVTARTRLPWADGWRTPMPTSPPTCPLMGLQASQDYARTLLAQALGALDRLRQTAPVRFAPMHCGRWRAWWCTAPAS